MGTKHSRRFSKSLEDKIERVYAYSDGIFAIAVTLLILEIKVPDLQNTELDQLTARLLDLTPQILTYALSFLVIGIYWMLHHRLFYFIKRYDYALLWLNNVYLMTIAFQPLPTAVLSRYGNETAAVVFYAGTQIATNVLKLAMWLYASYKHRLIDPNLSGRVILQATLNNISGILIFTISLGIAFFNTDIAKYLWVLLVVDDRIIDLIFPQETKPEEKIITKTEAESASVNPASSEVNANLTEPASVKETGSVPASDKPVESELPK